MFIEEELASFHGVLQTTPEFVEIDCGCTNPRYGDTPAKLRAYVDGKVEIDCNCMEDCPKGKLATALRSEKVEKYAEVVLELKDVRVASNVFV
ncbi:UNVERIFIED_CONTAM: hypothetical protein Slati_3428100 [Sesamum latifolium]|uniref:ULTRAPETALA1/2 SAND domain-containing protein n=1 Tax=Sesamum latifolium TaxID=2727402 RepID=A0AAW2UG57_9LAMI